MKIVIKNSSRMSLNDRFKNLNDVESSKRESHYDEQQAWPITNHFPQYVERNPVTSFNVSTVKQRLGRIPTDNFRRNTQALNRGGYQGGGGGRGVGHSISPLRRNVGRGFSSGRSRGSFQGNNNNFRYQRRGGNSSFTSRGGYRRNGFRGQNSRGRGQSMHQNVTKEELDKQLDEYMAKSAYAMDKELDEYMRQNDASRNMEF